MAVHAIHCEVLATLEDDRWLDRGWRRAAAHTTSTGRITVTLENVSGALADVTKIIGEAGGNLSHVRTLERSTSIFEMLFDVEVKDNRHLIQIVAALRASAYVVSANRTRAESFTHDGP